LLLAVASVSLTVSLVSGYDPVPELLGNQTTAVENMEYTLEGPLVFRDNSSLTVINGTLILGKMNENTNTWVHLNFTDNSRLVLIDSTLTGTDESSNAITMNGNSTAYIRDTVFAETPSNYSGSFKPRLHLGNREVEVSGSDVYSLNIGGDTLAVIEDSVVNWISPCSTAPTAVVNSTIDNIRIYYREGDYVVDTGHHGFHRHWTSDLIQPKSHIPYNLILVNSTFSNPLSYTFQGSTVTVLDTEVNNLYTDGDTNLTVVNSGVRYLRATERGDLKLVVEDSVIGELHSWMSNTDAYITGSDIGVLSISTFGDLSLTVEGCTIGEFRNYETGNQGTEIRDTRIETLNIIQTTGTPYRFSGVTVTAIKNGRTRGSARVDLMDVEFTDDAHIVVEANQTLTVVRHYRLIVTDNNAPARDVPVWIIIGDERTSEGVTNQDGEITFRVFYRDMEADTQPGSFHVQVGDKQQELGLFSDSPVHIDATHRTPRNILVAALIAITAGIMAYVALILARLGVLRT